MLHVAAQVVRVEDRLNVLEAVVREGTSSATCRSQHSMSTAPGRKAEEHKTLVVLRATVGRVCSTSSSSETLTRLSPRSNLDQSAIV